MSTPEKQMRTENYDRKSIRKGKFQNKIDYENENPNDTSNRKLIYESNTLTENEKKLKGRKLRYTLQYFQENMDPKKKNSKIFKEFLGEDDKENQVEPESNVRKPIKFSDEGISNEFSSKKLKLY